MQVDRQLYNVLPDEDLHERYGTCAIVGNSGSMLNTEYGRAIDAHDLVYRFNQVRNFSAAFKSSCGTRSAHGYDFVERQTGFDNSA